MPNSSSVVLTTVLKLIDKYDMYGQVAYPKHHKQSEVPDIYRLAAKTKVHSVLQTYLMNTWDGHEQGFCLHLNGFHLGCDEWWAPIDPSNSL